MNKLNCNELSHVRINAIHLSVKPGMTYYDAREQAAICALENRCDVVLTCNNLECHFSYRKLLSAIEEKEIQVH